MKNKIKYKIEIIFIKIKENYLKIKMIFLLTNLQKNLPL